MKSQVISTTLANQTDELKHSGAEIMKAWLEGLSIQYLVKYGYDDEWTEYLSNEPPNIESQRLVWRLKPI